jgi:hypothetical protein
LVQRGVEAIVLLASCMKKGTPLRFSCPHFDLIWEAVRQKVGQGIRVLDYSHY